jgi:hypothetical protein
LFLVVAPETSAPSPYEETIQREFADNFLNIGPRMWAISSSGIAKDVALKITGEDVKPESATLIVVAVSGYWGIAQNSVWEWFASKSSTVHASK